MYALIWHGEIIEDKIETREEVEYLQGEYALAYGGEVRILNTSVDIPERED